ncbi:5prime-nucleotidase, C-terminal domain [Popillia japonica]|uniref:5'-nucleotidase n=1 Tax=Popillia japonica TaxID=7064 RepID=A0AAW1K0U2_POPJA
MIYLIVLIISSVTAEVEFTSRPTQRSLRIFHTNNMNSQFEPTMYGNRSIGGLGRIVRHMRKWEVKESTLFIDSGDLFGGSDWFKLTKGKIWADMWNDGLYGFHRFRTFGEKELEYGSEYFLNYFKPEHTDRTLCANCQHAGIAKDLFVHFGYTYDLFGITAIVCPRKDFMQFQNILNVTEPIPALLPVVERLKTVYMVKMVIVISHCGYEIDKKLAKEMLNVDIVISGHSGELLYMDPPSHIIVDQQPVGPYPTNIAGPDASRVVRIVTAGNNAKYVGAFEIGFLHHVNDWIGNPVLMSDDIKEAESVKQILDKYRPEVESIKQSIVGISYVILQGYDDNCKIRECNLGNLITDAITFKFAKMTSVKGRWSLSGISIINGGAIATDLLKALPFYNSIYIVRVSGKELREALEHSVSDKFIPGSSVARSQFLQVSGIRVIYNLDEPQGKRIVAVKVRCGECVKIIYKDINPKEFYNIGMTDYLMKGGDGYKMFRTDNVLGSWIINGKLDLVDTVKEFMERQEFVEPVTQERIVLLRPRRCSGGLLKFNSVLYSLIVCIIVL